MPIQMLVEMGGIALLFVGVFYLLDKRMGVKVNKLAQAGGLFIFAVLYFKFRIYPPMPFSALAIYAFLTLIGIFMWVSSTNESWQDFRRPVLAVLDGDTAVTRSVRAGVVVLVPFIVWLMGWTSLTFKVEEPVELRTIHPAPPARTQVHGKTIEIGTTENPFRVYNSSTAEREYKYGNPWEDKASPYLRSIREGGQIYFQECHFCHGANLSGKGIFAHAFQNPYPINFVSLFRIMRPPESDMFWRTAKGGLALPREGFPWASVMPPMEQHLSTDEIWKVVLFEYWHTGYSPMTWD